MAQKWREVRAVIGMLLYVVMNDPDVNEPEPTTSAREVWTCGERLRLTLAGEAARIGPNV